MIKIIDKTIAEVESRKIQPAEAKLRLRIKTYLSKHEAVSNTRSKKTSPLGDFFAVFFSSFKKRCQLKHYSIFIFLTRGLVKRMKEYVTKLRNIRKL